MFKSEGLKVLEENVQSEHRHVIVSITSKTTSNSPLALETDAFFWVLMLLYISSVLLRVRVVIAQSLRYVRVHALLVQK